MKTGYCDKLENGLSVTGLEIEYVLMKDRQDARKALEEENRQKQKELLKRLNEPQEEVKETPKKKSKR